jgi:hypothetical protein
MLRTVRSYSYLTVKKFKCLVPYIAYQIKVFFRCLLQLYLFPLISFSFKWNRLRCQDMDAKQWWTYIWSSVYRGGNVTLMFDSLLLLIRAADIIVWLRDQYDLRSVALNQSSWLLHSFDGLAMLSVWMITGFWSELVQSACSWQTLRWRSRQEVQAL